MDPSTVTPVTSSIFTSAGNLVAPTNLAGSRTCAAPTPNPTFHLHVGPAKAEVPQHNKVKLTIQCSENDSPFKLNQRILFYQEAEM